MSEVWVAYDGVIHYKVDLENREVVAVEIPGWLNSFQDPGSVWSEDDSIVSLTADEEDAMMEILENSPMPEPYWG